MTLKLFLTALSIFSVTASAHSLSKKNLTTDLQIADAGSVVIYYMDGNDKTGYYVVVRNCGNDFPSVVKRSDCKAHGPENRVQKDMFKRVLKMGFLSGDPAMLKPFTPEEVAAYRAFDNVQLEKLKNSERQLMIDRARIMDYIAHYGQDESAKARLAAVEQELTDVRARLAIAKQNAVAVRKVAEYVNQLVESQIANNRKMTTVTALKDGDQAVFNLLKQFDASRGECGTNEILGGAPAHGVDDRIGNCALLPGSSKISHSPKGDVRWDLVSRYRDSVTGKFNEAWRDAHTSLVWGDALAKTYTHSAAVELGDDGSVTNELLCGSPEATLANGSVSEKAFGLPTLAEYAQAQDDGVIDMLPNMATRNFWTATLSKDKQYFARIFNGNTGIADDETGEDFRENEDSVRCVGR